jgi:hypothetical protein
LYKGLTAGGGVADIFIMPDPLGGPDPFIYRFFFDLSFFLILIIIWLNIIFGIIIDAFAELRDAKKFRGFFYI